MFTPYVPRPIDRPATVPLDPDADLSALDEAKIFAAPDDPADWPAWRAALTRWRSSARARVGYDGARYAVERTDGFVVALTWLWDELLYDHATGRFDVDGYLVAATREFGGFGGVVLWHAYPNEGIDERDQFAFFDVPELLVALVERSGADGVFLDSSKEGSAEVRAGLDALRPGLSMEGESRLPLARVHDHTASPSRCRTARDRSLLRSVRRVQREYRAWLQSDDWTPLADHPGDGAPVYASRWVHDGVPLWTVVNRSDAEWDGPWLVTDAAPGAFTELTTGAALSVTKDEDGRTMIGGRLPAGGVAAVLAADVAPGSVAVSPDVTFPRRPAVRVPAPAVVAAELPPGPARVAGGRHDLVVRYRVRETGLYDEAPYVEEWKPLPPRLHAAGTAHRRTELAPYAVGRTEVSNDEFAAFLAATGYRPPRPERFLAHWSDGAPPAGLRLPTEDEWQVAGEAGLLERGAPAVWNLTESEHTDGRTRFVILEGGSDWVPTGSDWYFDGGRRTPEFSAKYLLMGAGLDRSPSIGFRCAVGVTA